MSMSRSILNRQMELHVVGGQNLLSKRPKSKYVMKTTFIPGVVRIGLQTFYFLGFDHTKDGERNVGKTAGGAVIGTILAPVIGTIIGGAIGARKKDTSKASIVFADMKTQQQFSVTVTCDDYLHKRLSKLTVARMPALPETE